MDSDPKLAENRLLEILPDGSAGVPVRLPLAKPFTSYFTTHGAGWFAALANPGNARSARKIQPANMRVSLAFSVVNHS